MEESRAVGDLLQLLDERRFDMASRPELMSRQLAAAALTFASRALKGTQAVVEAGLPDLVGCLTRLIWECWCVGMYLVLDGDAAAADLRDHHAYRLALIARQWPVEDGEEHPFTGLPIDLEAERSNLNYEAIAHKVEASLRDRDDVPIKLQEGRSYDVLYRFESTWTSHATFGSFSHYMRDVPDGPRVEAIELRENRLEPADHGVTFAAMWVAFLAYFVFESFGLSSDRIEACLGQIMEDANRLAPDEPPELPASTAS